MTVERSLLSASSKSTGATNAVITCTTPAPLAYRWSDTTGFGAKYADPSVSSSLVNYYGVCATPDKSAVLYYGIATGGYLALTAYHWTQQGGFGAKYADLTASFLNYSSLSQMVMCPDGKAVAMSYQNSGATAGVAAASWDSTTGFGSFFSLPTTVYGVARGIAFNPAGTALLCTGTTTPYVYAYRFSSTTGFLTKYANPTALVSQSYGVAFSPDGAYCAVGLSTTNWFTWSWTDAGGFGTRTTRSGGSVKYDIEWTPAGDAVVAVGQSTGAVVAWPWSAGTLGTQSSVTMAGISIGCAISPSGKAIFRTISSGLSDPTLSIEAYPYNTATGIGTRYSYPSVLPAGYLRQIICI